jgi:hypothetical protein
MNKDPQFSDCRTAKLGKILRSVMNVIDQMWEAWNLCDASREYAKNASRDVPPQEIIPQEIIEKIFRPSSLIDEERTKRDGSPTKLFLKSPYGIEYRPDIKNWVPFRHGEIKFEGGQK